MNPKLKRLFTPILFGLLCVLPFTIMEIVNLGRIPDPFPYAIFLYLWLMFALFLICLFAIVRLAKSRVSKQERLPALLLNALVLLFTVMTIVYLLADQMPCFLGVPNCD
ncbi:MAG TPA: hypothetical protein PK883_04750 [Anaerolineaceae bacterium]|nr:hypothetical protein [Anaerolineaceae bacterium]